MPETLKLWAFCCATLVNKSRTQCLINEGERMGRRGVVEGYLSRLISICSWHGGDRHVAGGADGGYLLALGVDDAHHQVFASTLQPRNLLHALHAKPIIDAYRQFAWVCAGRVGLPILGDKAFHCNHPLYWKDEHAPSCIDSKASTSIHDISPIRFLLVCKCPDVV